MAPRSAEAGDPSAHADLANILLQGAGDPEDGIRTREWFEQAAAAGDLVAAFNFGVCLAEGVGVERDERKAARMAAPRRRRRGERAVLVWPHADRGTRRARRPGGGPRLGCPRRQGRHGRGRGAASPT